LTDYIVVTIMSDSSEAKSPPKRSLVRSSGSSTTETIAGLGCGLLYGFTSPVIGQPFDTIKTKMQADLSYMKMGMFSSFRRLWLEEGIRGLYRGILPPLLGSSVFRAIQFSVYGGAYRALGEDPSVGPYVTSTIPYSGGLQYRVFLAGVASSTARTFIETPLELIKVRRQLNQPWHMSELMSGFTVTWLRTIGLMCTFFMLVDSAERHVPWMIDQPILGPFFKGGICATLSWWVIWPFESVKSQIQGNTEGPKSILPRMAWCVQNYGIRSLFRGILPGSCRSLIANGASMAVFSACQDMRERYIH
jgi:solute carrier family 25 carnitine/acylcarnitine transporter 20/29